MEGREGERRRGGEGGKGRAEGQKDGHWVWEGDKEVIRKEQE